MSVTSPVPGAVTAAVAEAVTAEPGSGGGVPPVGGFNILNSSGSSFAVPVDVLDSDGNSFAVSANVLDSDGNSFSVI